MRSDFVVLSLLAVAWIGCSDEANGGDDGGNDSKGGQATSGGSSGAGAATGGSGASGGTGGMGSGGVSGGGAVGGAGAGQGSGGTSMSGAAGTNGDCDAGACPERCAAVAGRCPNDVATQEECVEGCRNTRCGTGASCTAEFDAISLCVAEGTNECSNDYTVVTSDCRSQADEYYACLGWVWGCTGMGDACQCFKFPTLPPGYSSTCGGSATCCSVQTLGGLCTCNPAMCDTPSYISVTTCPPP